MLKINFIGEFQKMSIKGTLEGTKENFRFDIEKNFEIL